MLSKLFLLSTLSVATFSLKTDFPVFDSLHANCGMTVIYKNQECGQVLGKLEEVIKSFNPEKQSQGLYKIKESDSDYVWTTRETPTHHYIDDILFETSQKDSDCVVTSKSRSQALSYYDYETNFCNMWAVHNTTNGFSDLTTNNCTFVPSDPKSRCAIY
eukprot:403356427